MLEKTKKPGRFLVLPPCDDCTKAESKAAAKGRPNPQLAVCTFHGVRRAEPEPMWGIRPGFVRANLRGAAQ